MIDIVYDTEKDNIFYLSYGLHNYIPEIFFDKYPHYTELHFIQDLLSTDLSIQFIDEYQMIWSVHYIYKYSGKRFTIILDENYDLISYFVDNHKDRKEIAEYICNLIISRVIE